MMQYACDPDEQRARADLDTVIDMVIALAKV